MWNDLRMLARFAWGLRRFLSEPAGVDRARAVLAQSRIDRTDSFIRLLRRAVFGFPQRPYAWLFDRAGIDFKRAEEGVRELGIEGALERWLDAGIYLTLDEFKGRAPIRRGGVELIATAADFDNPLLRRDIEASTSGSSGVRRRLAIDLDLLRYEATLHLIFSAGAGIQGAPMALWRPVPPGTAGIKRALATLRNGGKLEHWFTMEPFSLTRPQTRSWPVTAAAIVGSRLAGRPLPIPEYVPLEQAERVAIWIAAVLRRGERPHVDTSCSGAIRILRAAKGASLDLRGAFFRTGSEPLTPTRAAIFAESGCEVRHHFAISETGPVGISCSQGKFPDEVHLIDAKIAAISRSGVPLVNAPAGIEPLYLTTLLTSTPKLLINVESGDYANREERDCDCPFGQLGFRTHLHTIRSYEKLSSAGMHFTGRILVRILEEVLPGRFGGDPTDYQFIEDEVDGLPVVWLRVHPGRGSLDEADVVHTVLESLAAEGAADRMMAEVWRQGKVLRIDRRPPEVTETGKILALHQSRRRS